MIIRQVWKATKTQTKFVSIPKSSPIKEGDYVKIVKVESDVED